MESTFDHRSAAPLARTLLPTQPDRRLALLAREGHEWAFAEIVRRHRGGLVRYAAAIVPAADAEDVVQTALAKAHSALPATTGDLLVRPWLYRIVRNTALSFLRDEPGPSAELTKEMDGVLQPSELVERREQVVALLGAIELLPSSQRTAIVAREMEGRSHREIATALAITPGAARQLIHRARTTLRDGIGICLPLPLLRAALGAPGPVESAGAGTGTGAGAGAGGGAGAGAGGVASAAAGSGLKVAVLVALTASALATGDLLATQGAGRDAASARGSLHQRDAHARDLAARGDGQQGLADRPDASAPGGAPGPAGGPEGGSDPGDRDEGPGPEHEGGNVTADEEQSGEQGGNDPPDQTPPGDGEPPPGEGEGEPAPPGEGEEPCVILRRDPGCSLRNTPEKGTPSARTGRKARDLHEMARLPKGESSVTEER